MVSNDGFLDGDQIENTRKALTKESDARVLGALAKVSREVPGSPDAWANEKGRMAFLGLLHEERIKRGLSFQHGNEADVEVV